MGSPSRARHPARWFACDAGLTRRDNSRAHWLPSPHERTDELAVRRGACLGTESGADQKVARALRRVNPRRLQIDLLEAGLRELGAVLGFLERAGDAPDPQLDTAADLGRHLPAHDHVGHGEPPAWPQDPK